MAVGNTRARVLAHACYYPVGVQLVCLKNRVSDLFLCRSNGEWNCVQFHSGPPLLTVEFHSVNSRQYPTDLQITVSMSYPFSRTRYST